MKVATRPPLRRLLALDRMLRAGQYPNSRTAARELEVNSRTIHRDLAFLRDSWGAPLAYCPKRNGFYYCDPDYALPLLRLTEGELVALFFAERLMQQYRDSPFARDIATAFHKLTAALPDEVTVDLSHLGEAYSFRAPPTGPVEAGQFRALARAVREGRQLELVYWTASRDETCHRVVDPYHLVSVQGEWYLVAYCHLREEVIMFAPARVRALKETGEQFERPADFQIANYLDGTFRIFRGKGPARRVRLRFTSAVAGYVAEKVWHPTQQLRRQRDGGLIVTLKVNHLLEVKRWALSYGADCEVLEPAELREQVKGELRESARRYPRRLGRKPARPGGNPVTPSAQGAGPAPFRRRGQGGTALPASAAPPAALGSGRVPRLARLMALALRGDDLVRCGRVKNFAELARLGRVSRARVSQIMSLLQLAPDLQEELLFRGRPERGRDPWHLRLLLPITAVLCWREQRRRWRQLPAP